MSLFLMLLPTYLLGNFHCLGMCGPLVVMLGKHRYKYWYFLGRTLSFSLAGLAAGGLGAVLNVVLNLYHISALASFLFGTMIFGAGLLTLLRVPVPVPAVLQGVNRQMPMLLLRDMRFPTFLFGFATVFLPCGQTLIVFSACALSGDPRVGLLNGCLFALLTSPSLFFAMQAHQLLGHGKAYANQIIGALALLVGILACLRGLADLEVIPHLVLNSRYHVVLY